MPDIPEWVHVWGWMRFSSGDMRPLPQQGDHPEVMTQLEYREKRDEWVEAGSPTMSPKKLLAVMAHAAVDDDYDDIPF